MTQGCCAAAAALGALALSACAPTPLDTDDSESIALVEEFFAHLEAGEAAEAAALTSIDFTDEVVDDAFYGASAALPTDATIVSTTGDDASSLSAVVEVTLDSVPERVQLEVRVARDDDELRIAGWRGGSPITIGPADVPGTLTVNGALEYTLADSRNTLMLLPGVYTGEYDDPSRLTRLIGQEDSFTAVVPELAVSETVAPGGPARLDATPVLASDVEPGLRDAVEALQDACAAEGFAAPACPDELAAVVPEPLDSAVTAEWFREPGPEFRFVDGRFEATSSAQVRFSDDTLPLTTVSYSGTISRDASGRIVLTR